MTDDRQSTLDKYMIKIYDKCLQLNNLIFQNDHMQINQLRAVLTVGNYSMCSMSLILGK
jgi:hypothetical protein